MDERVNIVNESFKRCMGRDLMKRFYDLFLESSPDVKEKFKNTDFTKQRLALQHGINFAIMYVQGDKIAKQALDRLRKSHAHDQLDIHPRLYAYWKKSFLQALSESDPQYNAECAKSWSYVLQSVIDYMAAGYDNTSG